MAILNGIVSKMKGSAGNLTFKHVNGQTIVSEKATEVKNPRTPSQMAVRTRFTNIVSMYRGIRPLLNYGFESKAVGLSDYNMFVKVNMQQTPVYLTKQQVAGGACIAAPYQITQGSLPAIVISGEGKNSMTDIFIAGLTINSSTTVGDFSKAVVSNNPSYHRSQAFFNRKYTKYTLYFHTKEVVRNPLYPDIRLVLLELLTAN